MSVRLDDIQRAVRELALSDKALCVHSSLRSFGWVDGGAQSVINGLLAEGCTVMAPTFTIFLHSTAPPADLRIPRNGCDYDVLSAVLGANPRVFTPQDDDIDAHIMGAIPSALLRMPNRIRGNHPLNSFAAIGPLAEDLVDCQKPLDVYAPLRMLIAMNGFVLLMGVGFERMTLLHHAEQLAGRKTFRRWATGPDGKPITVEAGGCGFGDFEQVLSPIVRETRVGESIWKALPAGDAANAAARAIRENPDITRCGNPDCLECSDAVAGGPLL